jgi:hypothetical protein
VPIALKERRYLLLLAAVIVCYVTVSYLILPATWSRIEHEPGLSARPMLTSTVQGIPGDPINVGLIGAVEDVISAFHASGWYPADPITLRTSLEIVGSVLFDRPYKDAPVSPLFFEGRRQELAFEKPDGVSADRRQHVRFWLVLASGAEGSPVWLGSATFDKGVTLSRDTGQVTGGEHLCHSTNQWWSSHQGHGVLQFRFDTRRCVLLPAKRYSDQVHRQPGIKLMKRPIAGNLPWC